MSAKKIDQKTSVALPKSIAQNLEIMQGQNDDDLRSSLTMIMVKGTEPRHAELFFKGLDIYMDRKIRQEVNNQLASVKNTPLEVPEAVEKVSVAQEVCAIVQNQLSLERTPAPSEQVDLYNIMNRTALISGLRLTFGDPVIRAIDTRLYGKLIINDIASWIVQAQTGAE